MKANKCHKTLQGIIAVLAICVLMPVVQGAILVDLENVFKAGKQQLQIPKDCQSQLSATPEQTWKLQYQFPRVPYGYSGRDSENVINLPISLNVADPVFKLELRNLTNTGHVFFLRITTEDGKKWASRPIMLNWVGDWHSLVIPFFEMRGETHPETLRITNIALIVQQGMTSKMSAAGFARRGEIEWKNMQVTNDKVQEMSHIFFTGKVFAPGKGTDISEKRVIELSLSVPGTSSSYQMRSGIPLPEGVLYDENKLRLLSNNNEIPMQSKILARWPDGSIKVILLEFIADITGQKKYTVEYGKTVNREKLNLSLLGRQENGNIFIDSDGLNAEFKRDSMALVDNLSIRDKDGKKPLTTAFEGLNSILIMPDGTKFKFAQKTIELESNGPLGAVVKINGIYQEEKRLAGYKFVTRFYFMRGSKVVKCTFTFINSSGDTSNPMPDIMLSGNWNEIQNSYYFCNKKQFTGNLGNEPVQLFQDGAWYYSNLVHYPFRIKTADKIVGKGEKFDGLFGSVGSGIQFDAGILDCWQNNPKKIVMNANKFDVYLSTKENSRNPVRGNFYSGMAKTHYLIFGFGEPETVADFLQQPFLMASSKWLCDSGAFGRMLPEDRQNFPMYEQAKDDWIHSSIALARDFGDQYGLRDFGDYYGDSPSGWMNLETAVGMALFRQFIRTGRNDYLAFARQAVLHYADIDTCHMPGPQSDPDKELGAVYAHTYEHAGLINTNKRHNENYLGVGGHDWYSEVVYYYLLSGDEYLRDISILHADCTVNHLNKYFKENHVLAREYAWPVKNLSSFYEITGNIKYLQAAAKVMNFFSHWRDAFSSERLGNTLGQPGVCLEAIRDYYDTTRDPAARELLRIAGKQMFDHVPFLPGEEIPAECSYMEDARMTILDVLPDIYRITGDDSYIRKYVGYMYFYLQNRQATDASMYWTAPAFLKAMHELKIKEPFKRPFLPIFYFMAGNPSGKNIAEGIVYENQDTDFTISVSRVAAFRLGRVARGLIIGDWEGYPDNPKNEMKTSSPRLEKAHFGLVTVTAPDGKVIMTDKFEKYYSKTKTYKINKDGQTGGYKITVELIDDLYDSLLIDSSLPEVRMVNRDALPKFGTTYFAVLNDNEFSVKVKSRKNSRYGGAKLYAPDGKLHSEIFWNPDGSKSEYILKGKGRGIWKLERSMFGNISFLSFDGIPGILGASKEAFEER